MNKSIEEKSKNKLINIQSKSMKGKMVKAMRSVGTLSLLVTKLLLLGWIRDLTNVNKEL